MPNARQTMVVALGGNAISSPGKIGTIDEQFDEMSLTAESLCDAIERGFRLVITHGNGPQVGNILRRVEIASSELYPIPLEVCVADTQAGMGYMIAQCLANAMAQRNLTCDVTVVVTTVPVDPDDPAFDEPDKPIGSPMPSDLAEKHRVEDGWKILEVSGGMYRRVVPSPLPQRINELPAIERLVADGQIVVCCGGGGIPVAADESGRVRGVAAVIDKDLTTSLLAQSLQAATLVILTAVEHACLNYGKPDEQKLDHLTINEAQNYMKAGHFGAGSMRPKIEASIAFVRNSPHSDATAIIARVDRLADALDGKSGTRIVRSFIF